MEYAISVLLGVAATISLAGVAVVYIGDYATSLEDQYRVISHVAVYGDRSLSMISATYTNGGSSAIIHFSGAISGCNCTHAERIDAGPHTSGVVAWPAKAASGIIEIEYTFEDGTVTVYRQKLR